MRKVSFGSLVLALVASLGACAEEERPPPTRDEVMFACGTLNEAACAAFGRCLGWNQQQIGECVAKENAKCATELEAESCWESQRDALERCAADVEANTCSEVCNSNGFCTSGCLFFCPPQ